MYTLALLPWFPFLAALNLLFCLLCVVCRPVGSLADQSKRSYERETATCLAIIIAVASHGPTPWFVSADTRVYAPFIHMTGRPRLNGGDERVRVRKKGGYVASTMISISTSANLPQDKKKKKSKRKQKKKKVNPSLGLSVVKFA